MRRHSVMPPGLEGSGCRMAIEGRVQWLEGGSPGHDFLLFSVCGPQFNGRFSLGSRSPNPGLPSGNPLNISSDRIKNKAGPPSFWKVGSPGWYEIYSGSVLLLPGGLTRRSRFSPEAALKVSGYHSVYWMKGEAGGKNFGIARKTRGAGNGAPIFGRGDAPIGNPGSFPFQSMSLRLPFA